MTTREEAIERLRQIIGEAMGYGSLCWEPKPDGVFDSVTAAAGIERFVESAAPLLAEARADALNSAADDWPDQGIVSLWLRKRAESLSGGLS